MPQRVVPLEENGDFVPAQASAYRARIPTIGRTGQGPEEGIGQPLVEIRTRRF